MSVVTGGSPSFFVLHAKGSESVEGCGSRGLAITVPPRCVGACGKGGLPAPMEKDGVRS